MSQTNPPGGLVVQYTYNGDGLKIRRIEGATTTRYYHDGIRPLYETKADGSRNADLERDIFGNLLARQDAGGARYYYHHDGLGSTVGLTNASGVVAAQRTYDAWGNRRTSSGSAPGNYQFAGAELDPTSGLYHMGARFYDPTIGRWLTEDPVQDKYFEPATLNFHAYVFSNPLAYTDPDGNVALPVITGIIGAGLALGIYAATHQGNMTLGGALLAVGTGALIGASMGLGVSSAQWAASVRAATPLASQAVSRVAADPNRLNHIFGQAKHGFKDFGISATRGLALMEEILARGIAALGRAGGAAPGEVVNFTQNLTDTVRMVVVGRYVDGTWVVGNAFLQRFVNGQWLPWN